ncbi:MAG: 50S ribosomal protein L5 [Candidatus Brocadiia bacterium]
MSDQNEQSNETTAPEPRLCERYEQEIVPELMDRLDIDNELAVPELEKMVINSGIGEATEKESLVDEAVQVLGTISGQKPIVTRSRKSVAGFGIRAGVPVGCKVTLRRERMFEFLDRVISVVLPRIRDFRGLSTDSFDGNGNYSFGIDEHYVFPEVDPDSLENVFGMDVTLVTSAETDPEALELLRLVGMPFREE